MRLFDIAIKDVKLSFRSVFAVGMMLIAPLLITGLIYLAFGGLRGGDSAPSIAITQVVVANLDRPREGVQDLGVLLMDFLESERLADLIAVHEVPDEATARDAVNRQEAGVALIIPGDFSQTVFSLQGHASLFLLMDPTLTIGPKIVQDLVNQFVDGFSGARIALQVVQDQTQARGATLDLAGRTSVIKQYAAWVQALGEVLAEGQHPALQRRAPASLGQAAREQQDLLSIIVANIMTGQLIFFAFYTGAYAAMSIVREDEEGTLQRLFTTATPRAVILGGKFVAIFLTVIVQALVLMTAAALLFGISWGRPATTTLAVVGLVIIASGFGLLLMSFAKTTRQAGPLVGGVLSVTGMLGGLFTASVEMPPAFQTMSLATPQGWALRTWTAAVDGKPVGAALLPFAVTVGLGALFFAVGVVVFRRRFA